MKIKFKFIDSIINKKTYEKTVMLIPVYIDNITNSEEYFMQLDLGTPKNLLYISEKLNFEENKILENEKEINIYFADKSLAFNTIKTFQLKENLKLDTGSENTIGTLGLDIMVNNTIFIDFVNTEIILTPIDTKQFKYCINIDIKSGNIIKNVTLKGTKRKFIYDTGSSMFSILHTKYGFEKTFKQLKSEEKISINSWGNSINVEKYTVNEFINIGNKIINLESISSAKIITNWTKVILKKN